MKEKDLELLILRWLNKQPYTFAFKVETSGYYDKKLKKFRKRNNPFCFKGTSDIIGCKNGRFFAIEVKLGYNKPTLHQLAFLECVEKEGYAKPLVAYSLEDVISFFDSV